MEVTFEELIRINLRNFKADAIFADDGVRKILDAHQDELDALTELHCKVMCPYCDPELYPGVYSIPSFDGNQWVHEYKHDRSRYIRCKVWPIRGLKK